MWNDNHKELEAHYNLAVKILCYKTLHRILDLEENLRRTLVGRMRYTRHRMCKGMYETRTKYIFFFSESVSGHTD